MTQLVGIDTTEVSSTIGFELGTIYTDGSTGKKYKYVQYDTGAGSVAAVSGNVTYYYLASGYDANIVTSDLSDSVNVGAGVLQSAPTDGQYCWIQIRGAATLNTALTAGADGNALTPVGSTDGTLDVSAAVTDHVCAIADDISAKEIVCMFPE
jgi:hypothetical protein